MALLLRHFFHPTPACYHPAMNPTATKYHRICLSFPKPNSSSSILRVYAAAASSDPDSATPSEGPKKHRRRRKPEPPSNPDTPSPASAAPDTDSFPSTIPRKPRRGRRSETTAVEDFVRASLERTFAAIREQGQDVLEGKGEVLRERVAEEDDDDDEDEREQQGNESASSSGVVEEEDPDWPLDADVGWGVRASEYFEKHPIRNVVVDGMEIDWEGESDNEWVKEINCLEWESFAFHPSPLIVLVFERYKRAADNWKALKELEKAAKVYWSAKDRLPPRTVKIDINIETDLAYALKVREGPQLLFLRGNKIVYREKEIRTSDELVPMIAFFYYNARKPSWIDENALAPPYLL